MNSQTTHSQFATIHYSHPDIWRGTMRLALFMMSGAITTLAIFWAMSQLVAFEGEAPMVATEYTLIDPMFQESDPKTNYNKPLPEPPKALEKPLQQMPDIEDVSDEDALSGFNDSFVIAAPQVSTEANTALSMGTGGDARPIVRISPRYPVPALRDGIEGWVRMSFSINATGGVEDVTVIDAEPARVFNREAIRALRKWKYKPRVEGGRAIRQTGMAVELTFSLKGEQAQ